MAKKKINITESICKNVKSPLKLQIETMTNSLLALQKKLDDNYDEYLEQPLSTTTVVNTGSAVRRPNPFVQEYRATYRDYIAALKALKEITSESGNIQDIDTLVNAKERFKIAK